MSIKKSNSLKRVHSTRNVLSNSRIIVMKKSEIVEGDAKTLETTFGQTISKIIFKNIFIFDLGNNEYCLSQPMSVIIECEDNTCIATNYDTGLFGYGDTEHDALMDLREAIIECFEDLRKDHSALGVASGQIWNYLSRIITQTNAAKEKRS